MHSLEERCLFLSQMIGVYNIAIVLIFTCFNFFFLSRVILQRTWGITRGRYWFMVETLMKFLGQMRSRVNKLFEKWILTRSRTKKSILSKLNLNCCYTIAEWQSKSVERTAITLSLLPTAIMWGLMWWRYWSCLERFVGCAWRRIKPKMWWSSLISIWRPWWFWSAILYLWFNFCFSVYSWGISCFWFMLRR